MNHTPPASAIKLPPACSPVSPTEIPGAFSLRHRKKPWVAHQKLVAASFLGDACIVFLALMAAYIIRFDTVLRNIGVGHPGMDLNNYLGHVVLGGVLLMFMLANFRAHDPRNYLALRRTLYVILKSCTIWLVSFLGLTLILKLDPPISRMYCLIGYGLALAGLSGWRWFLYCIMRREYFATALRQKAVFVGWNEECARAAGRFSDGRAHQIAVVGVVAPPEQSVTGSLPDGIPLLGEYHELRGILRETGADLLMAVDGTLGRDQMLDLAECCGKEFVDFKLVPSCFQVLVSGLQLESFHGMPVLGVGKLPLYHAFNNITKRGLDIAGSIAGLMMAAPVIAVFGLLVWMESRGPVIYRQRRIGLNGRPFHIYKIRSMKLDAEASGAPGWTVRDDPRRLKIGKFMREWNIDELPQFWNVLRGEMSLVGPRPERPELIEGLKEEIPHYNVRHNIKPGVTGWAQVNGLRGDTCLRERVKFDLDYIENWNFMLDIQILAMTLFTRKGAC